MDSTDKKILNILQGNARISMKELGTGGSHLPGGH